MLPSSVPLAVNYDTHMDVPTSISGQGIPLPNGDSASGQFQQEGRLACPCCGAKLGKFDMVDGLACSCGVEASFNVCNDGFRPIVTVFLSLTVMSHSCGPHSTALE